MIIKRIFHNVQCDHCGALLDEEMWWDDADAFKETFLGEFGWIECEGRHYCQDCWHHDDEDNIVTADGRKWSDFDYKEIKD